MCLLKSKKVKTTGKYHILILGLNIFAKRNELVSRCRHASKYYLSNYQSVPPQQVAKLNDFLFKVFDIYAAPLSLNSEQNVVQSTRFNVPRNKCISLVNCSICQYHYVYKIFHSFVKCLYSLICISCRLKIARSVKLIEKERERDIQEMSKLDFAIDRKICKSYAK